MLNWGMDKDDPNNASEDAGSTTQSSATLYLPPHSLASCVITGVERDTRERALREEQRFNFFPASPFCTISWFFEGTSYLVDPSNPIPSSAHPVPQLSFAGPQTKPMASWNPGVVHALTVGIYPEAWKQLVECDLEPLVDKTLPLEDVASGALLDLCKEVLAGPTNKTPFQQFMEGLGPIWISSRAPRHSAYHRLSDWTHELATKAASSGTGKSVRQAQRRIKSWTGQNQRDLQFYARNEALFEKTLAAGLKGNLDLAEVALDAGFSDQAHMGRSVRKLTGMSPAKLNHLIATAEAFWCYRLIGERF